jgi:beta-galactosidase GanA
VPGLWPGVFERLRANGYNAVATDLYWGYHSSRPGAYDFTGVRDLDAFFDDAARAHFYVVVRSGPYIDSGADAGGLPDWMLAHTANRAALAARYLHESRAWIANIDPIVARHQLTEGSGTIVLDEIDGGRPNQTKVLERAARHDGVTVPFASLVFGEPDVGFHWGWTGTPSGAANETSPDLWTHASFGGTLPAIYGWRARADNDEISQSFEDQAWPPLIKAQVFDSDDDSDAPVAKAAGPEQFFGVDDYGFHHGAVWYRGHFIASGNERAFWLTGIAGASGGCGVWLNGQYLGSSVARNDGILRATFPISTATLRAHRDNTIAVLFENAGHEDDVNRDNARAQSRGLLQARLNSGTPIAWRILGNGEYNADPVRGPLNAGGLAGEIAGWQNPSFSDRDWRPATLPAQHVRPGATWYRARVQVDAALPDDAFFALRIDGQRGSHYHASIFCNGWLMAHIVSDGGGAHVVPLLPGILVDPGENTLAVAVWNRTGGNGLGNVAFTTVQAFK